MSVDLLAKAIHRLTVDMREFADGALSAPQQRDAYEYGRVSGFYAGLQQARDILRNIVRESTEVIEHGESSRDDAARFGTGD